MTLSLDRRSARWTDRPAVVDVSEAERFAPAGTVDTNRITYGELHALAAHAAGALSAMGVEPGNTVCSLTRNRVSVLALVFACRRLGATFAPLSHRLSPVTVARPLEALDPDLVVFESAQRDLVGDLPPTRTATFEGLTTAGRSPVETPPKPGPMLALHDEDGSVAAYSPRAVEWNCLTVALTLGIGRDDRLPLLGPLSSYDGLLRTALPALYVGATLLLDRAFDPADALATIRDERATLLCGRAVAFRELAARDGFGDALDSVSRIVSETPPAVEIRDAYAARGTPIDRAYGRLECPTALVQSRGEGGETAGTVVGRPVLDCEARLVDGEGTVLEGAAEGWLELAGPVCADVGRPTGGWVATGDRFSRDETGVYRVDA
ncbi:AMP-binding protein [Natrononativus amylolyticus]|uniref:AMP-binding protein n=1 Tax=Natrononativus amylolyticus TaxID=2963434 RepID=UPI0020CC9D03|nr:AMP-binding protein [Natrononativus amylolyticus]